MAPGFTLPNVRYLNHTGAKGIFVEEHMDRPTTAEVARFFDKVRVTKHCWLWEASLNGKRYGHFWHRGQNIKAHRFSYALFVRPIKPGKQILHRRECGNPSCVNPHHLYMGTHTDNMRDKKIWGDIVFGERVGVSKLSESDVRIIRKIYRDNKFNHKYIGELFNVDRTTVGRIVRGEYWRRVH